LWPAPSFETLSIYPQKPTTIAGFPVTRRKCQVITVPMNVSFDHLVGTDE